jgi:hypothetical protein
VAVVHHQPRRSLPPGRRHNESPPPRRLSHRHTDGQHHRRQYPAEFAIPIRQLLGVAAFEANSVQSECLLLCSGEGPRVGVSPSSSASHNSSGARLASPPHETSCSAHNVGCRSTVCKSPPRHGSSTGCTLISGAHGSMGMGRASLSRNRLFSDALALAML